MGAGQPQPLNSKPSPRCRSGCPLTSSPRCAPLLPCPTRLPPENHGQNLAFTNLRVPYSLDSGIRCAYRSRYALHFVQKTGKARFWLYMCHLCSTGSLTLGGLASKCMRSIRAPQPFSLDTGSAIFARQCFCYICSTGCLTLGYLASRCMQFTRARRSWRAPSAAAEHLLKICDAFAGHHRVPAGVGA